MEEAGWGDQGGHPLEEGTQDTGGAGTAAAWGSGLRWTAFPLGVVQTQAQSPALNWPWLSVGIARLPLNIKAWEGHGDAAREE